MNHPAEHNPRIFLRAIGPMLIGIAFVAMLALTWRRWPDPLVDFGRELYVPWQLSLGKTLYRDIAHLNGPASQYFNALIFRIFGASVQVLVMTNIAIALAMIVMIWQFFRAAGDRLSATVACLLFVTLFMSMQYVSIGNYNWITPYSHELTHGVALSLAGMLAVLRFRIRSRAPTAALAGLALGLIFLTKPEVFIAAVVPIVAGFILTRPAFPHIGVFVTGAIAPLLISTAALSRHGTLGAWPYLLNPQISSMRFYRLGMGTEAPLPNTINALLQAGVYVAILLPAILLDLKFRHRPRKVRAIVATGFTAIIVAALLVLDRRDLIIWRESLLGVTPVMVIASIIALFVVQKRRPSGLVRAMLIGFASLLLAKIFLVARLYHYGFALALPATLTASAMAISWLPPRGSYVTKCTMLAVLALLVFKNVDNYVERYRDKPAVIARGKVDEFFAGQRGRTLNEILATLARLPDDSTLAVLPQGVMVNYLTGRVNPTKFITLMPPEVLSFGDDAIAADYAAHPPDYILNIPEEFGEYGFTSFQAFAPKTDAWVHAHYAPVIILRHDPKDIIVLKRLP